jgi:hypothetical protein
MYNCGWPSPNSGSVNKVPSRSRGLAEVEDRKKNTKGNTPGYSIALNWVSQYIEPKSVAIHNESFSEAAWPWLGDRHV